MSLLDLTREFLNEHKLDQPGIVAVSGGPDSVALAHVLVQFHQHGHSPALHIAHLNHSLRGPESDTDEEFVRSLPAAWNVTGLVVHSRKLDVREMARQEGWNLEDAGRRARYAFFEEVAARVGAVWVATAHTADDQAETVLMRLLRGTGVAGLAGMPVQRELEKGCQLIRPWLAVRKTEVREYLQAHGLTWREDSSNASGEFLRNRIRSELIPYLEREFQSSLVPLLNRLAGQASEVHAFLEEQGELLRIRAEKPRSGSILVFDLEKLNEAPDLILREMFRSTWLRERWSMAEMGWEHWNRLARLVRGLEKAIDLPHGVHGRARGKVLQIIGRR